MRATEQTLTPPLMKKAPLGALQKAQKYCRTTKFCIPLLYEVIGNDDIAIFAGLRLEQ